MVRIRKKDGATVDVDGFVEVVNNEGQIGILIYEDATGQIHIVNSDDEESGRYRKLFGVDFCPVFKNT